METVEYKNISFTVWDVGGQDKVCFYCNIVNLNLKCAANAFAYDGLVLIWTAS